MGWRSCHWTVVCFTRHAPHWRPTRTRTHAMHLDSLCLCRLVSIPLSLVSCLSRLLSLVCRLLSVFCLLLCLCLCLSLSVCTSVRACPPCVQNGSSSRGFLRAGAPDIQIEKSIKSDKSIKSYFERNKCLIRHIFQKREMKKEKREKNEEERNEPKKEAQKKRKQKTDRHPHRHRHVHKNISNYG